MVTLERVPEEEGEERLKGLKQSSSSLHPPKAVVAVGELEDPYYKVSPKDLLPMAEVPAAEYVKVRALPI